MKYAWIENERIRDIAPGNPAELYHPDIAQLYGTEVPDDASNGDGWVNSTLIKPEPAVLATTPIPDPIIPPKIVSPVEFKLLFTSPERIAIKAARATDPVIDDFYDLLDDPRLSGVNLSLQSTQDAVGYMAMQGLIEPTRV